MGSNQSVVRAAFLPGGSRGETVPLAFLASLGCLYFLALGPFLPFSKLGTVGPVFLILPAQVL